MVTHGTFEFLRLLPTFVAAAVLVFSLVILLVVTCCEDGENQHNRSVTENNDDGSAADKDDGSAADKDDGSAADKDDRSAADKVERSATDMDDRSAADKFFHRTVCLILGDWIEYCPGQTNQTGRETSQTEPNTYYIKIDDVKIDKFPVISRVALIVLFFYAITLVVVAIVTFFELFLFSTSSTCSNSSWTFCFPTGDNSAERIRNCTMLEGDVICYQLELNFVTAAGVIGGLLTIINFLTTSLNYRVIKYYCKNKKKNGKTNNENGRPMLVVTVYIILLLLLVALLAGGFVVGAISRAKNGNTTSDIIVFAFQYIVVILAILLGGLIPMSSALC